MMLYQIHMSLNYEQEFSGFGNFLRLKNWIIKFCPSQFCVWLWKSFQWACYLGLNLTHHESSIWEEIHILIFKYWIHTHTSEKRCKELSQEYWSMNFQGNLVVEIHGVPFILS